MRLQKLYNNGKSIEKKGEKKMKVEGTNLSMTRGDSETITISCEARPFREGDVIRFTVKEDVFTKAKEMEKVVTEFTEEGEAVVVIQPEDTRGMGYKGYRYDVQLTTADGTVTTIVKPSEFRLTAEVTWE